MRSISCGSTDVAPTVLNSTRTLPSACVRTSASTSIPLWSPRERPGRAIFLGDAHALSSMALRAAAHERSNVVDREPCVRPGATS